MFDPRLRLAVRLCLGLLLAGTTMTTGRAAGVGIDPRNVVIMIGEDEYKTWETLPAFAEQELAPRGYRVRVILEDAAANHEFPGLVEALRDADLLVVSVRRRAPPRAQLEAVRRHLAAGKALIGIRTASHAFDVRDRDEEERARRSERGEWEEFDREVLGGNYSGHHGAGPTTTLQPAPGASGHPVLAGLEFGGWKSQASLYKAGPLVSDAQALLVGSIPDQPVEPVAWTRFYGSRRARVFYTSLGHESDFANAQFRRLLVNAVAWALAGD